jgi:hypothetical protein
MRPRWRHRRSVSRQSNEAGSNLPKQRHEQATTRPERFKHSLECSSKLHKTTLLGRHLVFRFNSLRRRLSIRSSNGALSATISPNNNRATYVLMLVMFTCVFAWFLTLFARPFFKTPFSSDNLYLFPFLGFVVLWYVIGVRIALWRLFGVEKLIVESGVMRWTRKALFWARQLEVPTKDITGVRAVTPWHAQSNRVEFTALGKRRSIGDMLLRDEAIELSEKLRNAVGPA